MQNITGRGAAFALTLVSAAFWATPGTSADANLAFPVTPAALQARFDRGPDRTSHCVEVHWVTQCGLLGSTDAELDILRGADGLVSGIELTGNGSPPGNRARFIRLLKTLLHVLSPRIGNRALEDVIDRTRLRAPAPDARVVASFAVIACSQTSSGISMSCAIEPPPN